MDAADALRAASARLESVSDSPRLDAELLLAHALDLPRDQMLLRLRDLSAPEAFDAFIDRRLAHEPVAYIVGNRDFWTINLRVTPDVLIPRPDTETLLDAALTHFAGSAPKRILDLGTGSGALLLAALDEWPEATGMGVDRSFAALAVARANAVRLGLDARADFRNGDWASGIDERFDLILINPPYIATSTELSADVLDHEPHMALFAGADGLDDYRIIAPQLGELIAPGGLAALEIGFDQGESAAALFRMQGLQVTVRRDLAGRDRCLEIMA